MLDRLVHRGPDDARHGRGRSGTGSGHRRLSIVDVDGGHQPLRLPDDSALLVGNGEIYNHATLRRRASTDRAAADPFGQRRSALHLIDRDGPEPLAASPTACSPWCSPARTGASSPPATRSASSRCYWARRGATMRFASRAARLRPGLAGGAEPFPPGCYWTPETGTAPLRRVGSPHRRPGARRPGARSPRRGRRGRRAADDGRRPGRRVPVRWSRLLDRRGGGRPVPRRARRDPADLRRRHGRQSGRRRGPAGRGVHRQRPPRGASTTPSRRSRRCRGSSSTIESFDPALVRSAVPNFFLARGDGRARQGRAHRRGRGRAVRRLRVHA